MFDLTTHSTYLGWRWTYVEGIFHMPHSTDRRTHTTAVVAPVVEHWMERDTMSERSTNGATSRSFNLIDTVTSSASNNRDR